MVSCIRTRRFEGLLTPSAEFGAPWKTVLGLLGDQRPSNFSKKLSLIPLTRVFVLDWFWRTVYLRRDPSLTPRTSILTKIRTWECTTFTAFWTRSFFHNDFYIANFILYFYFLRFHLKVDEIFSFFKFLALSAIWLFSDRSRISYKRLQFSCPLSCNQQFVFFSQLYFPLFFVPIPVFAKKIWKYNWSLLRKAKLLLDKICSSFLLKRLFHTIPKMDMKLYYF